MGDYDTALSHISHNNFIQNMYKTPYWGCEIIRRLNTIIIHNISGKNWLKISQSRAFLEENARNFPGAFPFPPDS